MNSVSKVKILQSTKQKGFAGVGAEWKRLAVVVVGATG